MNLLDMDRSKSKRLIENTRSYIDFYETLHLDIHKVNGVPWMALSHGSILLALFLHGEMTMTAVAEEIKRTAPTTTTLVKRLKKEGMVESKKVPDDNRKTVLSLTEKGRDHCRRMDTYLSKIAELANSAITEEEVDRALAVFEKLKGSVMPYREEISRVLKEEA